MKPESLGPVQVLVIEIDEGGSETRALEQLRQLRERSPVRTIDVLLVRRQRNGSIVKLREQGFWPEGEAHAGSMAGALLGLDVEDADPAGGHLLPQGQGLDDADAWCLADQIPPGTSAAIALLEHRWAMPLREAVTGAGRRILADAWIHPEDLAAARGAQRGFAPRTDPD